MDNLPIQIGSWLLSTGIGAIASYKLLEWRVSKNEFSLTQKLDKETCLERRKSCEPCSRKLDNVAENMEEVIRCINKYVDDCTVGLK